MDTVDLSFMKITKDAKEEEELSSQKKPLPLVIIHGLFGSKMNFYSFSRGQSREHDRDCYLVDLRNHGASGHHDTDMTFTSMSYDLDAFLDQQGIEECDLLGFSLGGKVSMTACLNPNISVSERVRKLVIGDIAPVKYNNEDWDIPDTMRALSKLDEQVRLGNIKRRSDADEILKAAGISGDAVRAFLLTNLDRNSNGDFFWKFNLRGLMDNVIDIADFAYHPDQEPAYKPFNKPTLFLVGERSRLVQMQSPEVSKVMNTFFPNNQMTVFPACGHWVHTENPKLFKQTVEDFLNHE